MNQAKLILSFMKLFNLVYSGGIFREKGSAFMICHKKKRL